MIEQERLYLNDKLIELATETSQFSRTLQVNDLVSLDNRQTNFTKNIKIPKTPKNVLTMDFLGVVGNNSNLPYQKNNIKYFIGNEAIIYNGWGVITETNAFYNLTVYDGNLDLYKSIENKTLADLSLTAITHTKTLATVVNSFTANLPYKYILADYNGKAIYNTVSGGTTASTINIDYLVPSVKVSYLWDNIFSQYGFTYEGSIFSNIDFTNLYLTYPKSIPADLGKTQIYDYSTSGLTANSGLTVTAGTFTATEQITIDFTIFDSLTYVAEQPNFYYLIVPTKNGVGIDSGIITLNSGDVLAATVITFGEGYISGGSYGIDKIYKYNSANIEFGENLSGFIIKDFINEILQRFGLSIFKDKYTNNYKFKTLAEITNDSASIDWTSKFQSVDSEKYIYGSYAQKNILKYKYNDENANYNDGAILVNNKNIDDTKTIIQSKIYSPEANTSNIFGFNTNVYKIWNKEVKDTGVVTYKDLENRFHFIRSYDKNLSTGTTIGSEILLTNQNISVAPAETFSRLSFQEIVANYYPDISKLLNKSKIIIANINLKYTDISDFDFTKLYFIKQLGGYYLVNKILNFQIGYTTKVEMIRVNK
ncbi:hypothetical protein ACNQGL_07725 [Flavobacterium sp. LB3P21]|uniref:hypothetical protein n=1 Tax=Flavobacterium sp. LB3P21 TaxID=3401719 RepID=UPI003AAD776D